MWPINCGAIATQVKLRVNNHNKKRDENLMALVALAFILFLCLLALAGQSD